MENFELSSSGSVKFFDKRFWIGLVFLLFSTVLFVFLSSDFRDFYSRFLLVDRIYVFVFFVFMIAFIVTLILKNSLIKRLALLGPIFFVFLTVFFYILASHKPGLMPVFSTGPDYFGDCMMDSVYLFISFVLGCLFYLLVSFVNRKFCLFLGFLFISIFVVLNGFAVFERYVDRTLGIESSFKIFPEKDIYKIGDELTVNIEFKNVGRYRVCYDKNRTGGYVNNRSPENAAYSSVEVIGGGKSLECSNYINPGDSFFYDFKFDLVDKEDYLRGISPNSYDSSLLVQSGKNILFINYGLAGLDNVSVESDDFEIFVENSE